MNYFKRAKEFTNHKLVEGLKWYKINNAGLPKQDYKVPQNAKLPHYMLGFNLGSNISNRIKRNDLTPELEKLTDTQ